MSIETGGTHEQPKAAKQEAVPREPLRIPMKDVHGEVVIVSPVEADGVDPLHEGMNINALMHQLKEQGYEPLTPEELAQLPQLEALAPYKARPADTDIEGEYREVV